MSTKNYQRSSQLYIFLLYCSLNIVIAACVCRGMLNNFLLYVTRKKIVIGPFVMGPFVMGCLVMGPYVGVSKIHVFDFASCLFLQINT